MKYLIALIFGVLIYFPMHAQDSLWTLNSCIEYAKENNISIQQTKLDERATKMQWEQGRFSQFPNISFSTSYGKSFGRSINPTSNEFENATYDYTGFNGNSSVLLFGWFQKRNTIQKNKLVYQASVADLEQLNHDLSLNVTTGFLRILLAKEQIEINENQLSLSGEKVKQTELLLKAGRSNGLDMAQMETQLITDSTLYYKSILEYNQAIIDIKAVLNLSLQTPFVPATLSNRNFDLQEIQDLNPETIFEVALNNQGSIKSQEFKVESAKRGVAIAQGALYPQLNLNVSSGTNYSSTHFEYLNGQQILMPWGKQIRNNLAQSVSLSFSIPLFNGLSSRYTIKQAKIAVARSMLDKQEFESVLRQTIYKAWNEMHTALQTYYAAKSAALTAEKGYNFAIVRYEKGLINATEFLIAQNTNFKAKSEVASSKYDLMFKIKIIKYFLK